MGFNRFFLPVIFQNPNLKWNNTKTLSERIIIYTHTKINVNICQINKYRGIIIKKKKKETRRD